MLPSADRPIRAGDILILVRKRAPFAPAMISALKARGIDVAGADRLVLTEQIAVQDLMALGDFLNLPDDDLALASVLKSPLFGLDDDDLIALAQGRTGSLWEELRTRALQTVVSKTRRKRCSAGGRGRSACRPSNSIRRCSMAKAVARGCWRGSARRRPMPSTSSSTWRWATTRRAAVAAGVSRRAARGAARDQARHGAGPQRGARDDRARRQGSRGADRLPARHLHDEVGPAAEWPAGAGGCRAPQHPAAAVPVAGEGHQQGRRSAAGQGADPEPKPRSATDCSTWR